MNLMNLKHFLIGLGVVAGLFIFFALTILLGAVGAAFVSGII